MKWLLLALSCTLSSSALALEGSSVRGGGNDLVAKFVGTANNLLKQVSFKPEEKKYISRALGSSKIISVATLIDPVTQKPVPNQEKLVAWGSVNLIQLKEKSKNRDDDSFEKMIIDGRPIAHIVIHELIRASGWATAEGNSPDDQFEISIGKYHLNDYFEESRAMWLYAQCEVTKCERVGVWNEEDVVCPAGDPAFTMGWGQSTVQIYKYQGRDPGEQRSGLLKIANLTLPLQQRFGSEVLDDIRIDDGSDAMTISGVNNNQAYRNFTIPYSREGALHHPGHAEVRFGQVWVEDRFQPHWVALEMDCQTLIPFPEKKKGRSGN